mgnify:CR=1 FL=1
MALIRGRQRKVAGEIFTASMADIVFLLIDDLGWADLGCYGSSYYETPRIDRLAREGMLFTDAYAQQSCTAGRAAFITGQSPIRTGLLRVGMPGADLGLRDRRACRQAHEAEDRCDEMGRDAVSCHDGTSLAASRRRRTRIHRLIGVRHRPTRKK